MPDFQQKIEVRVNGRGNAWPILLGSKSNFYDSANSDDLSSASYSVISHNGKGVVDRNVNWEILVDAGHHIPQYLIKNNNRIPEAIVLTHGHPDHVLGLEWIAQSYFKAHDKKKLYPIYATRPVWEMAAGICPRLPEIATFKELIAGTLVSIEEVDGLQVTAFPVFHGERAFGASMLFFEHDIAGNVLFTGDMLCPLLREKDYDLISTAKTVFVDTNNRYPYPPTNHGSFVGYDPNTNEVAGHLTSWRSKIGFSYLTAPHARTVHSLPHHKYFEDLQSGFKPDDLPANILEFVRRASLKHVQLVHYSGSEDKKHYGKEQLSTKELMKWANREADVSGLKDVRFVVPEVGDVFEMD